jgi:hypothetical protein
LRRRFDMKHAMPLLMIFCLALAQHGYAGAPATQTVTMRVTEASVLGVTGNPGVLTVTASGRGGDISPDATDNSTYAQYTSIASGAYARTLTAAWGPGDSAPSGCRLRLEVTGLAAGWGSSVPGGIAVSTAAQSVITGIGSCATGTGSTDGARLTYTLRVNDAGLLDAADDRSVTITLTLTDVS